VIGIREDPVGSRSGRVLNKSYVMELNRIVDGDGSMSRRSSNRRRHQKEVWVINTAEQIGEGAEMGTRAKK